MPHSHTLYVAGITDYDELRRYLVKAVEAGVTGKQDIKQALDQAVAIWNKKPPRSGAIEMQRNSPLRRRPTPTTRHSAQYLAAAKRWPGGAAYTAGQQRQRRNAAVTAWLFLAPH
jgi:hypothetical protein